MLSLLNTAKAGDVFLLLEPSPDEFSHLRQRQKVLQSLFGGRIYENIHLTCQRFAPKQVVILPDIIKRLEEELALIKPFSIIADSMIQFYVESRKYYVLRWCVQDTDDWRLFKSGIEDILVKMDCPPHYPSDRPATCTALEEMPKGNLIGKLTNLELPYQLFRACRVVLSKMEGQNQFKILRTIQLS